MQIIKSQYLLFFFISLFAFNNVFSQSDSLKQNNSLANTDTLPQKQKFNKKRLRIVVGTEATLYAGSLIGLNYLWYANYPRSSFHLFDDDNEWLQMDKCGHATTAYYIGRVGIGLMNWSGVEHKKAIWYGGLLGSLYQLNIEIMDGFSTQWGFSIGDFSANTFGSALVIGEALAWDDQRIVLKYSFQQSKYSPYRPNELGSNLKENMIKDYNGQTYWLSVNPYSFMHKGSKFPKWLNVALGYGAEGMTGAVSNPPYFDSNGNPVVFERSRQFYLSLDIDLTRIKTKSAFLKTFFNTIGFIKFPAPSLEFNKYGVKGHWLGF